MADKIIYHDPLVELLELRNQLSYSRRIGCLFGAGTSKALGVPDVESLTLSVENKIKADLKPKFQSLKKSLIDSKKYSRVTVEELLNQVRLIRQITFGDKTKTFDGINGEEAKNLDLEICDGIYDILIEEEGKVDLSVPKKFCAWLNWLNRDFSKEIFTINYDLILERSLEALQIPYFDGFIGSNEPFFLPESLDFDSRYDSPPNSWLRLWKLHGSLGWFWKASEDGKSYKVLRLGVSAKKNLPDQELVIYPSREKYESSRKQPFIAYFDRLKAFLQNGEGLFLISGYSFSDEHINAVIFDSLKQNNRLHIIGFFYEDKYLEELKKIGLSFMNFSAFSPKKAIIKGLEGEWKLAKNEGILTDFWDVDKKELLLGDFAQLVKFLLLASGKQEKIEKAGT